MSASHDARSGQFPGGEWRRSLPAESDAILRRWEKDPRAVGSPDRAAFRTIMRTAPAAEGSVYRGQETKSGTNWIMPLDRQEEYFRSMIGTGRTLRLSRHTSASSLPEVAAGFGHTVYKFTGHQARSIGNSLHEAVLPPGTYEVTTVWRGYAQARAPIDGRTTFSTEQVRVTLRRVKPGPPLEFPAQQRAARKAAGGHQASPARAAATDELPERRRSRTHAERPRTLQGAAAQPGNRQAGRVLEFPSQPGLPADPGRSLVAGRRAPPRHPAAKTSSGSPKPGAR